jgi:hypothetical protein
MTEILQYPFKLIDVFFPQIYFHRAPEIGREEQTYSLNFNVKVVEENYPSESEIHCLLKTEENSPIAINLYLVAKYEYIGDDPERDRGLVHQFAREKAVYLLWPQFTQLITTNTSLLGLLPSKILTPFNLDLKAHE